MKIIGIEQIKKILPSLDLIPIIEKGFVDYSAGKAIVPPVGELILEKGEVHIKYGYLKKEMYYVIKIASGFYNNSKFGLPTGNGMMLLFSQETGEPLCLLHDEGYLTDVRTAIAGAIATKYLAPKSITRIGIIGTGVQARMQLKYLTQVINCRDVLVWGRGDIQLKNLKTDVEKYGYRIETTLETSDILRTCNLITTVTPATSPLLLEKHLQPGTHINGVGSDTTEKQELEASILARADLVACDSLSQCLLRGEIYKALELTEISEETLIELGDIIAGKSTGRLTDEQITVADLTGVAVQDINIATAVYEKLKDFH